MIGAERSLLSHLDAPIVVGDPDGRTVYVNPAFESRFERGTLGLPLAELFEGGAREAVLRAVASACDQGESVRFRLREKGVGFSAVASPIVAEGEQVGVVILFKEEVEGSERLLALHRELQAPLDEIGSVLDTLFEQTGGRRNPHHRALVEDALRSLARLRKWADEVHAVVAGAPARGAERARFDATVALRNVARRAGRAAEAKRCELTLLVPSSLPEFAGDASRVESVLLRLVEARLTEEPPPRRMTLSARIAGDSKRRALLLSLTEHRDGAYAAPFSDEPVTKEAVASLGAELGGLAHRGLGRTTLLRFTTPR
jgi:hypothetical protein